MSKRKAQRKIIATAPIEKHKPAQTTILRSHQNLLTLLISLSLIAVTVAVFAPLRSHTFLNYDDDVYITENGHVQTGLTFEGVIWAFTTTRASNWHPLTWLSHMLDCQLYGLNPSGHHLTNLIFHLASTLLLFIILKRTTGAIWRSGFVAVLFALHPLHVESVAWAAERKDVLSAFFWLLTMWAYVLYVARPRLNRYLLVVLFFILGLLSKPMLVTLPFVLLLFDYWPLGRFQSEPVSGTNRSIKKAAPDYRGPRSVVLRLVYEKIPLIALAAVSSCVTYFAQQKGEAVISSKNIPMGERIANALIAYAGYLEKMMWPRGLAVFYPYPDKLSPWLAAVSALVLFCVSILAIRVARKFPSLLVGWLWYLGTLIPVIGLVQVGSQAMADRYTYVPLIGPFIMIAWSVPAIVGKWRSRRIALSLAAGALLSLLIIVSRVQVKHWQNSATLFEHSIAVTSNNSVMHYNLGVALAGRGNRKEAMSHFAQALKISPNYVEAHNNLGVFLAEQGKTREAISHFVQALLINPESAKTHKNLGLVLASQGKIREALIHFTRAVLINPDYADAHLSLGSAYLMAGDTNSALGEYKILQKINPDLAAVLYRRISNNHK